MPSPPLLPPPPRGDIDWTNISTSIEVNGHVESRWHRSTGAWSKASLIRDPFLRLHGLATVFHYGQEAYEGLKAFRAPNGDINIIRPDFHATRLNHSSSLVSIPPITEDHFVSCVQLAVAMNAEFAPPSDADGMLYIRPVVFGSGACIALEPPDEFLFCVYVATAGAYYGADPLKALILEDFDRAAPRGTGSGKVGGNYAPVMRWSRKAKSEGFDITLHLDSQTRTEVEEFSTSAFVGIKSPGSKADLLTLVIPDSSNVVSSVTCDSIRQLAKHFGWRVERRPIKYEELPEFTEILACGTAVTIVPIKSITRKSTSDTFMYQGSSRGVGPCATKLVDTLRSIYKAQVPDPFQWLTKVDMSLISSVPALPERSKRRRLWARSRRAET